MRGGDKEPSPVSLQAYAFEVFFSAEFCYNVRNK